MLRRVMVIPAPWKQLSHNTIAVLAYIPGRSGRKLLSEKLPRADIISNLAKKDKYACAGRG